MADEKYDFTEKNVNSSPDKAGVYMLYENGVLIYIGRAKGTSETIRTRLVSHFSGNEGRCTQRATHYWREENNNPVTREKELLESYKSKYGKLPRCNERIG